MKNWLIEKLGGFTTESVQQNAIFYRQMEEIYKKHIRKLEVEIDAESRARREAQSELERLKEWRNNAAKTMRQSRVPRHVINKIMVMKND